MYYLLFYILAFWIHWIDSSGVGPKPPEDDGSDLLVFIYNLTKLFYRQFAYKPKIPYVKIWVYRVDNGQLLQTESEVRVGEWGWFLEGREAKLHSVSGKEVVRTGESSHKWWFTKALDPCEGRFLTEKVTMFHFKLPEMINRYSGLRTGFGW